MTSKTLKRLLIIIGAIAVFYWIVLPLVEFLVRA